MDTLHQIFNDFKDNFGQTKEADERGTWFIYTLLALIIPFVSSKSSNLLRCLHTLFGLTHITKRRFYIFMASPKIPWDRLWLCIWKAMARRLTEGRMLIALDDYINPKTGKKVFGCHRFFDHAAKQNQARYPWAQNVVSIGWLASVKGRWACLPLSWRFYHPEKSIKTKPIRVGRSKVVFHTKFAQAASMICEVHRFFQIPITVVADSWFGNAGLWKPVHRALGECFHLISRLRCNIKLFDLPAPKGNCKGRPRKYGEQLGNASSLAPKYRDRARTYYVRLYGRLREVVAFDRVCMLKTLKCKVRVVWIFRKNKYVALFTTDLSLSVQQIIENYGARWKIESGFKELKQEIGSAHTQCRDPHAVVNHLHFCMMATSTVWIYAMGLENAPARRHAVKDRAHFAFSDVRRLITENVARDDFRIPLLQERKSMRNSIVAAFLRMAA